MTILSKTYRSEAVARKSAYLELTGTGATSVKVSWGEGSATFTIKDFK